MKWLDPMPTDCPACGGRFPLPVAELRSLRAACPGCGASLATVGERMLAEEVRIAGEVDLFQVGYELSERYGLTDEEFLTASSLGELARAVAERLALATDREAKAVEIVAEVARRVAPLLLREDGPAERLARARVAYSKHAETDAPPNPTTCLFPDAPRSSVCATGIVVGSVFGPAWTRPLSGGRPLGFPVPLGRR